MVIISFISFSIIQLPPGDYLTSYIAALGETGETVDEAQAAALRGAVQSRSAFYGAIRRWLAGMVQGDLGMSFEWNRPVTELIGERICDVYYFDCDAAGDVGTGDSGWDLFGCEAVFSAGLLFYVFGFIGLATPNFLLALIFMYIGYSCLG